MRAMAGKTQVRIAALPENFSYKVTGLRILTDSKWSFPINVTIVSLHRIKLCGNVAGTFYILNFYCRKFPYVDVLYIIWYTIFNPHACENKYISCI